MDSNIIAQIQDDYIHGMLKKDLAIKYHYSLTTIGKYTKGLQVLYDDMVGRVYGQLTVLRRATTEEQKTKTARVLQYVCQCSCGTQTIVDGATLRSGHTSSCGCSRKGINVIDITGQCFGKLQVLQYAYSINRYAFWLCKCECGKTITVCGKSLRDGNTKSCGCLRSWKEQEIKQKLIEHNIEFQAQYAFDDLVSQQGYKLHFDFAIFKNHHLECLIEYQGDQHYDVSNSWHTAELEYSDAIKKEYCLQHNYTLIELNKESDIEWTI